jgi:MFS transporter, ACS family, DAL5 transporter family protein
MPMLCCVAYIRIISFQVGHILIHGILALRYISIVQPFYSLALFTPTIIKELGYTNANANLLSVPPYVFGFITTLLVAIASDRLLRRGIFLIGAMLTVIVGYIILITNVSAGAKYCASHVRSLLSWARIY